MNDPLLSPLCVAANWLALDKGPDRQTRVTLHGFALSVRSVVLLYADVSWLMTLKNPSI